MGREECQQRSGGAGFALMLPVVCALLAAPAPPAAADPEPAPTPDPALAARIFDALGVRAEMAAIVPVATARLLEAPDASAADRRALGRIVARSFDPERLERGALLAFVEGLDVARARRTERWLEQPAVRALHAAAGVLPRACRPGGGTPERLELIRRIEARTGAVERGRRYARLVSRQMLAAAATRLPDGHALDTADAAPPARQPSLSLRARACRYAGLDTDALAASLDAIEGEPGGWLYPAVSRAIERALSDAARRTAYELIERFEGRGRRAPVRVAGGIAPGRV